MGRRWQFLGALVLVASGCAGTIDADSSAPTGRQLSLTKNCVSCHTVSGARSVGPTWHGLFGSSVQLEDGRVVVADSAYLERSMREPQADIVAGFTTVSMPTIDLTPEEVDALVAYIRSLDVGGAMS